MFDRANKQKLLLVLLFDLVFLFKKHDYVQISRIYFYSMLATAVVFIANIKGTHIQFYNKKEYLSI